MKCDLNLYKMSSACKNGYFISWDMRVYFWKFLLYLIVFKLVRHKRLIVVCSKTNEMASNFWRRMKLSPFRKAYALLLREEKKFSFRKVATMSGMSKSSAHRIWKKNDSLRQRLIGAGSRFECREPCGKPGPKPKLNTRDKRMLLRTLHMMRKNQREITVISLVKEAGLDPTLVHRRTFTKYLNALGFKFLQARKKGLLSDEDKKKRFRYACDMKKTLRKCPDFYVNHISFYLDGVSFIHKFNPMKDARLTKSRVCKSLVRGFS
jgi:hypothetical protein